MSKVNYQLMPITSLPELCALRDLYRRDWPDHCVGYYCLDNFIRWLEQEPEIQFTNIYTLNGNWRSEGLFLVVDRYQLFVNSLNQVDNSLLTKALSLLDWRGGYKVSAFLQCHREAVLDVIEEKELTVEFDHITVMYYMPCKDALKLEVKCIDGYYLQPLSVDDAETIDEAWPHRHQGSLFLIRRLIAWNVNMGVYDAKTNELVAWCLRLQGGFLGALQVRDTHQRLGLGSLVTSAIAVRIAKMGHDVMALVGKENDASRGLFEKLDFKILDTCYWLKTSPLEEGFEWPEGE